MNYYLKILFFLLLSGVLLFYSSPLAPAFFDWDSISASVEIEAVPEDAQIKLNEKKAGGKLKVSEIDPGKHYLQIKKEGFHSHEEEITLDPKENLIKEVKLQKKSQEESQEVELQEPEVQQPKASQRETTLEHLYNIQGVPSPKAGVFSPDGSEIWSTSLLNENRGVFVFNVTTGEKIKSINLDQGGGVEITFARGNAYVSQMETARIFEIDLETKEIERVFNTGSTWTKVLKVTDEKLYASNWTGNDVSVIDLETEQVEKIATVDTPRGIALHEDFLYVAGFGKGQIQKVNLKTGQSEVIFDGGGSVRHLAINREKGEMYASDMPRSVVWKVDLETDQVSKFAETENNPNTITLSPDNKILAVSCRGKNYSATNYHRPGPEWGTVMLFNADNGNLLEVVVGGNQPTGLDLSPNGERLVFSNFLDNNLEAYKMPSFEELKQSEVEDYKEEIRK